MSTPVCQTVSANTDVLGIGVRICRHCVKSHHLKRPLSSLDTDQFLLYDTASRGHPPKTEHRGTAKHVIHNRRHFGLCPPPDSYHPDC